VNEYYETVFAEMISEGSLSFKPVFFNAAQWYEIDTIKDLQKSELIFPKQSQTADKINIESRFQYSVNENRKSLF
jgi:hypothetical protein